MRGPAGDAIFIVIGILVIALVTIRLWYPPLVRWMHRVRDDVDKVQDDEVQYRERQMKRMEADKDVRLGPYSDLIGKSAKERQEIYRRRARGQK